MFLNLYYFRYCKACMRVIIVAKTPVGVIVVIVPNMTCCQEKCKSRGKSHAAVVTTAIDALLHAREEAYAAEGPLASEWKTTG
jgi:hypothetical protein